MKLYVARDKDGSLYLYDGEPAKRINMWDGDLGMLMVLEPDLLPEVKWEDSEPTEVELVIKKKDA